MLLLNPKLSMVWRLFISHKPWWTKIDAFQLRCLRKILGLASTFIDRRNTNQAELKKCTDIVSTHRKDHKQISLFSEYYLHRKTKLLGHVLRAPEDDPLRQVSFEPNSGNRVDYGKLRCGRPKQNWRHFAKKTAYEMHLNGSNYLESVEHDFRIYNAALNREF